MYKRVQTDRDRIQFDEIWEQVWKEKGFNLEYSERSDQFIFQNEQGTPTGSMEIKRYTPDIEIYYPFSKHICISDFPNAIYEIDKVSILKESRRKRGLDSMILFLRDYTHLYGVKYFVALIEPSFYIAIRMLYRLPLQKLHDKFFYKGDMVIPILIDAEDIVLNESKYPLLRTIPKFQYGLDMI